ncbi:hypothetical protein B0A65_18760 [Flavobacterium frigidimaris]|uniref:Uncharacterized protein n=1 Tax=Flavobacterium frigidimaris TaxID=262320 RepID=A0ABX4BKX7_FLAFR|nr:hypothetical protein B0A65_18760 [Flavobacterium frigidimaris]
MNQLDFKATRLRKSCFNMDDAFRKFLKKGALRKMFSKSFQSKLLRAYFSEVLSFKNIKCHDFTTNLRLLIVIIVFEVSNHSNLRV